MALINCPKCGKTISDKAVNCPGCGYTLSEMQIDEVKDTADSHANTDIDMASTEKLSQDAPKLITMSKYTLCALIFAMLSLVVAAVAVTYALSYKKMIDEITSMEDKNEYTLLSVANTLTDANIEKDQKEVLTVNEEKNDDVDQGSKAVDADQNVDSDTKAESYATIESVIDTNPSGHNNNENITFCDDYVVDIDYEITNIKVKSNSGLEITYKLSNNENFPIEVHACSAQYFDDIAVKKDWSELPNPIHPQKSAIGSIEFYGTTISPIGITHIDTLTLRMYITDENGINHIFEIYFEDVNIDF